MFRSLMTIIRELYLYLTKVIFMLKHSVKLRLYIYIYIYIFIGGKQWQTTPKILPRMQCARAIPVT